MNQAIRGKLQKLARRMSLHWMIGIYLFGNMLLGDGTRVGLSGTREGQIGVVRNHQTRQVSQVR